MDNNGLKKTKEQAAFCSKMMCRINESVDAIKISKVNSPYYDDGFYYSIQWDKTSGVTKKQICDKITILRFELMRLSRMIESI